MRDRARTADTKVANRKEEFELDEKKLGLWDRIRAKKASGRKMNPKGQKMLLQMMRLEEQEVIIWKLKR